MEEIKPFVEKLARFGCYSIAAVYIMVGVMAILSFMGKSKPAADEERIVNLVMELPMGEVIIAILILGLLGYVTWRVYEAFADPYHFGSSFKGRVQRIGIGLSASAYLFVAYAAAQILFGGSAGDGEQDQQMMVSQVLGIPGGAWLVGLAGGILGFTALIQLKYVSSEEYHDRLRYDVMSTFMERLTHVFAWVGYIARSIILTILAYFFITAAVTFDADAIGDTDSAFDFIGDIGPVGHVIFIAVAIGTICYGLFMILNGYFYSFEGEEDSD